MIQTKEKTSFIDLIILIPLFISACMWLGVGADYLIDNTYLFFSQNSALKELFDLVSSLYQYNENNPFMSMSDTKLKIVSTMIVVLLIPFNLLALTVYTFSKKGGN